MKRSIAGLVCVLSFWVLTARASDSLYYYRADGRRTELRPVERNGSLVVPVNGTRSIEVTRRILLRTREAAPPASLLSSQNLELVRPLRGFPRTWILEAKEPRSAIRSCATLAESGLVVWAVPDLLIPVQLLHHPNDPLYDLQWHLLQSEGEDIAVEDAWDITRGDAQVVVAVLDTGVDPTHPDLDTARMVNPQNILTGSDDPSPHTLAIDGHGTACMGLVAATADNQVGVSGICPQCSWMPVRIFGDFAALASVAQIAEGITYAADQGAWIISNSWGIGQELIDGGGFDMALLYEAVRHATTNGRGGKGCLVLFAAGNGDGDLNATPIGPDELPAMDETLAIGGCDHTGRVARYSDYGPYVSVIAPTWSGWVGDPKIVTTDSSGNAGYNKAGEFYISEPGEGDVGTGDSEPDEDGNYTSHFTGTSAATPIAAGVAALVLSANPDLDYTEVREILQSTAEKVGGAEYDEDGHNIRYGYGRVHAHRAVAVARYGRDQEDGAPCVLDLNCAGVCRTDPPDGGEPECATACVALTDCSDELVCTDGYCVPKEPDPEDPDVVVQGGCACSPCPEPGGSAMVLCLFLLLVRRRQAF